MLPDTTTRLTLAILSVYFDPHKVLKTRCDTLRRFLRDNASGNHPHSGPFIETLVTSLKDTARNTLSLHAERVDFRMLQLEVHQEVELLKKLSASGVTIATIEHNINIILELSDHILALDQGQKIAFGTAAEIQNDQRVIDAYLGTVDVA